MKKKIVSIISIAALSLTISTSAFAATGTVERGVNFRSAPSTNSSVYQLIHAGSKVEILNQVNSYWYQISYNGKTGYVSSDYVRSSGSTTPGTPSGGSPSANAKADRIIAHAQALKGVVHYSFGVNKPTSVMDCSAFTKYVFGLEGVSLKWGTRYQKDAGSYVAKGNLKKGDLVFFWTGTSGTISHVGIYIGNGQFIHNSPSFNGVGTSSLTSGYWSDHYITARRVL
ncbi:C40 family peptidase [Paenibacillus hodogayensis]|uniref:C40 family peptidase n=1 Tax=Paenibacillus hodogayensis TaxID=279208 RepID=A0ABV5W593_9BACL